MNEDNAVEEALSRPLLDEPPPPAYEDMMAAAAEAGESSSPLPPPSYSSELGESNPESNSCRSKLATRLTKIPTIAYILIAIIGFLILMFLSAAVFFPPKIPDTTNHTNHTNHTMPPPLTEGSVRDGDGPKGIHISFTESPSEIHIQFSTQNIGKPVVELAAKDNPTDTKKFDGTSTTYLVTEMCEKNKSADVIKKFIPPGQLHTVRVADLKPRTEYIYRAGISTGQGIDWGDFIEFRSPASSGYIPSNNNMNATKPLVTFLALADQGTDVAAKNVSNLITTIVNKTSIDSIHIIGDLSYADGHTQIWGNYMDMIEPFASRVPTMVAAGNHEYDYDTLGDGTKDASGVNTSDVFHPSWGGKAFHDEGGECGVSIAKRFAAPNNGNKIFWYSFQQELVHTVVLSSEHNMTVGSPQYAFLEKELSHINRTITPWVVVEVHRPLYNSEKYWEQDAVGLGMRNEIEEVLYMNKVDLVLSGHYHGYLRSCDGVYREKCSSGGPMHITLGTGGGPLDCHKSLIPNHYTDKFDGCNFGVGRMSVYNASALHFEFVTLGEVVLDDVWLVRQRAS